MTVAVLNPDHPTQMSYWADSTLQLQQELYNLGFAHFFVHVNWRDECLTVSGVCMAAGLEWFGFGPGLGMGERVSHDRQSLCAWGLPFRLPKLVEELIHQPHTHIHLHLHVRSLQHLGLPLPTLPHAARPVQPLHILRLGQVTGP